jgi:multiple antibiotic resistance protein
VNPIEAAPFFLALTPNLSNDERRSLARRVAINGFALLLGSMVLGPSISVAITIGSRKPETMLALTDVALHAIGAFGGVVAIAYSIYIAYRFAGTLARWLGTTGIEVMVRLSAFILMCIGIQIVWNGYSALTVAH